MNEVKISNRTVKISQTLLLDPEDKEFSIPFENLNFDVKLEKDGDGKLTIDDDTTATLSINVNNISNGYFLNFPKLGSTDEGKNISLTLLINQVTTNNNLNPTIVTYTYTVE